MYCGFCSPEKKVVVLGLDQNIVEFDYEKMKITKNVKAKDSVYNIEKINDEIFLTGES